MRNKSVLHSGVGETLAECSESRGHSIFVGGFPCQDLSAAAPDAAGLYGDRSGLWEPWFKIIEREKPTWIVTENVAHTWRRWVPQLRLALHSIGYSSLPLKVRASDVGADHERARIFIIAHADSELLWQLSWWLSGEGRKMATEFAKSWDKKPKRLGNNDGLPSWVDRRTALGNAIVPQIAEIIACGIRHVSLKDAKP